MNLKNFLVLFMFLSIPIYLYSQEPNPAKMQYDRAVEAAVSGNWSQAKSYFQSTLDIDSLYVPARLNMTVIDNVDSLLLDSLAAIHYFKGIEYGNMDNMSEKIEELNQAILINPDFGLAYNERGIAWAKLLEYNEAVANYDRALLYLPESAEIYFNKALSCDKLEEYDTAAEAYQKFLDYTPQDYLWYIIYARKRIYEITEGNNQK